MKDGVLLPCCQAEGPVAGEGEAGEGEARPQRPQVGPPQKCREQGRPETGSTGDCLVLGWGAWGGSREVWGLFMRCPKCPKMDCSGHRHRWL